MLSIVFLGMNRLFTFWYVLRKTRKFSEKIRLNNVSQVPKQNITLASWIPIETFLNRFVGSKMIRKDFQSIKESIPASLSPTD
jgi:hypothetical protein